MRKVAVATNEGMENGHNERQQSDHFSPFSNAIRKLLRPTYALMAFRCQDALAL